MIRKYTSVLLLTAVFMCLFSSCGINKANLYVGVSQKCDENTLISEKGNANITQDKIRIEKGKLEFSKNNEKNYDSLYFSFDGNNIESVSFQSENAKILDTNLNEHSYYVDSYSLYKEVTEEQLKSDFSDCRSDNTENYQYDSTKILKKLWDNGEFDDIKNVYFGGESSDKVFIPVSRRNKTYDITGIFPYENFSIDEKGNFTEPQKREANYMGKKSEISQMFFQWDMNNHLYGEKVSADTYTGFDPDNVTLQPDEVTVKYNQSEYNSVRWVYEILYNNAVKDGKTDGLIAEDTIKITINYTFGQSESCKLNCKLYADGKINLELEK